MASPGFASAALTPATPEGDTFSAALQAKTSKVLCAAIAGRTWETVNRMTAFELMGVCALLAEMLAAGLLESASGDRTAAKALARTVAPAPRKPNPALKPRPGQKPAGGKRGSPKK